jgi:5-formyltetrahydrofolate cyclo-ligase
MGPQWQGIGQMNFQSPQLIKQDVRKAAYARRKAAHRAGEDGSACQNLIRFVADRPDLKTISAYMPIRTELDPRPAMEELHALGHKICVPVIQGHAKPLLFREWTPDSALIEGDFGAMIPRGGAALTPDLVVAPLLAFDTQGYRLGYGGGFYDRSLEELRAKKPTTAVGFAFAAQKVDAVPIEDTDQRLDAIITEDGLLTPN